MKTGEFNQTIIEGLFRKHFDKKAPPLQVSVAEKEDLIKKIKSRMKGLSNVVLRDRDSGYYVESALMCIFDIKGTSHEYDRYFSGYKFSIAFDEHDKLIIGYDAVTTFVSNVEEIFNFVATCQEIMETRHAIQAKHHKIHDMKIQAITSQVKLVAEDQKLDELEFHISEDSIQFKLNVRISNGKEYIELRIPFKKFKEIVPNLRTVIISLMDWHKAGLKAKMKYSPNSFDSRGRKWTKYVRERNL
jgi:hypothetical protein